jgi:serine/threonine protein kinase
MDERYDSYCAVDPLFYDALTNTRAATREYRPGGQLPAGWRVEPHDDWLIYGAEGDDLPAQGWKIHVSAGLDNAERVLDTVSGYCVPRGLGFKHLRGPQMLLMRNAKYAARGSSGKFITIYPHDDAELAGVCEELSGLLDGETGPYILSDLRYGPGPLYLRYGGFAARYCLSDEGQVVPAIADPDGTLVPDRRDPVFHLPSWVALPDFLAEHLAARNATTTSDVPYQIDRVLHFSNGGGLYAGRDMRTGDPVILKEGRPLAGLDATGADAISRLRRERDTLRALADVPQIVRVHDSFALGEHEFLVLDEIAGQPLNKVLVARYPLIDADATGADRAAFTAWVLDVHGQVARVLADIHRHGIVYGDLHLFNVMVGPDDRITLLDFEVAGPATGLGRPALRNQAFAAPRDRTGFAVDEYALACLGLALFLPLTSMLRLALEKVDDLAAVIADNFPVPPDFLAEAVRVIRGESAPVVPPLTLSTGNWPRSRTSLAGAILASATPDRDDRLFPGDIEQFHSGGLNLGHGAAGVLWALSAAGAGCYPQHEEWLITRATHPVSGSRLGFYDGLHGVAYALHQLGHRERAREVLDICLAQPWHDLGADLVSGLAGVGLNLAYFAGVTGDPALRDAARQATELVADRLARTGAPSATSGGSEPYAGLARGASGAALLFLRLYEQTGDTGLLDQAAVALRRDLHSCVVREDGAMEVDEGWRTMPYLAHGSVGIGMVLDQYLRHRDDEAFQLASLAIRRAARSPFYAQSGLFAGRAGIIAYLASRRASGQDAAADDLTAELHRQARRLAWHAVPYRGFLAFPGEQLLRLSMDLATGTAGVLLALAMVHHTQPVTLPFLAPLPDNDRALATPRAGDPAVAIRRAHPSSTVDEASIRPSTVDCASPVGAAAIHGSRPDTDFRRAEERRVPVTTEEREGI